MLKNKINFKLINVALVVLIIFLMYQTGSLWIGIFNKLVAITTPLLIAFALAYALYPILKYFTDHKVPKSLGILIIISIVLLVVAFLIFNIFPLLFSQLISLFSAIITFLKDISINYDLDIGGLQESLSGVFNDIIVNLGKYVSNGALSFIGDSFQYISLIFIIFSLVIYFLIDMESIRENIGNYLRKKSKKFYRYISLLDNEMKNYLSGFVKIMIISLFEYTLAYMIIGHPNAMLLGVLALLSNLIPYFGGVITNVLAAITAIVVSPALLVRTIITFIILSALDGYFINPMVYGKTNKVPPLVVIMSVFTGGILFGIVGIIISLPLAIIILTTINYFKDDINYKIEDVKGRRKSRR